MATILPPIGRPGRSIPLPRPRINGWIVGGLMIAGIGAMLPVLETSVATTRGFDNQELVAERIQLEGEIRQLEAELANFTSLQRIERRARNLGLVPVENPIYIEISEPGPEPAHIPAGLLPQATPETVSPESFWASLVGWLPLPD